MVDQSKLTQYNWWGNENAPPDHLQTRKTLTELGFKPRLPVGFIEGKKKPIYLYDLSDPLSATPPKKKKKNPIIIQEKIKQIHKNAQKKGESINVKNKSFSEETGNSSDDKEDFLRAKIKGIVQLFVNSIIIVVSFFSGNLGLMTFSFFYLLLTHSTNRLTIQAGRKYSFAIRQEAEDRICELIYKKFQRPGMRLFAIQDNNYAPPELSRTVELILHLPPDRVFLISIRSLVSLKKERIKIYYNNNADDFRFVKGKAKNQKFDVDPIQSSHERANWLTEHHPELIPRYPIEIVVFANPKSDPLLEVCHRPDTPLQVQGRHQFIFHKGVYVIEETDLITLIMRLTPKPETKSQK